MLAELRSARENSPRRSEASHLGPGVPTPTECTRATWPRATADARCLSTISLIIRLCGTNSLTRCSCLTEAACASHQPGDARPPAFIQMGFACCYP